METSDMKAKKKTLPLILFIVLVHVSILLTSSATNGKISNKTHSFTFVQLCDPQLGFSGYEQNTDSFKQSVRQINALNPDFVVICGDLVNAANDQSYRDFKEIKDGFKMPCYSAPGNHDIGNNPTSESLEYYRKTMGEDYFTVEHKATTFVFVNTQLWKEPVPAESDKQDVWLKEKLEFASEKKHLIFIIGHYPLFCRDANEPDEYMNLPIEKRCELLSLFEQYNVAAVLGGHAHRLILNNYRHLQMVNGETISQNFDNRPLGFRVWHVEPGLPPKHQFVPLHPAIP